MTALCFLPAVGAVFLHGIAYGDEVRVALRAPGVLLIGPIEVSWAVLVAGLSVGPLLLAAQQWVIGAVLTAVGLVVVFALAPLLASARPSLGRLRARGCGRARSPRPRRSGAVSQRLGAGFAPAPADTDATDLTMGAPGLAVEIALTRKIEMIQRLGRSGTRPVVATKVLVTPTRPGVASAIASDRRVGRALPIRGDRSPSP